MSGGSRADRLFAVLLLVAPWVAYGPALHGGFVWDDSLFITENPLLGSLAGLRAIWLEPGIIAQYYPLAVSTFWIEHRLWGLDPAGYHAVNLALQSVNGLLVSLLLRRLGVPGANGAALLFALHPVHVESVVWISERKNLLSGLFYLSSALVYLRFRGLGAERPPARPWLWVAAFALFVCALLSKTVTASLPAAILLVVWWKEGRIGGRDVALLLPFFVAGLAAGLNTAWMEREHVGAAGAHWELTLVDRGLIASRALVFYCGKLLWPASLAFSYPRWEVDPAQAWQYLYAVVVLAVVAGLWLGRQRIGRGPLAAALFFAGTLFPALGFVDLYPMRFSFVADHFQYLASLGPIALAAAGVARGLAAVDRSGPRPARVLARGAIALVVAVLTIQSFQQSRVYESEETLWRDTLAKNPDSSLAHNNLGRVYGQRGEHALAARHFERAAALTPGDHVLETNLAESLLHLGDSESAIVHARLALDALPDHASAHYVAWRALRRLRQIDDAVVHLRRWAELEATFEARYEAARRLALVARHADALDELAHAERLDPGRADVAVTLGRIRLTLGQPAPAVAAFRRAVAGRPDWVPALMGLGQALEAAGEGEEARMVYESVLEVDPVHGRAHEALRRLDAEGPRTGQ